MNEEIAEQSTDELLAKPSELSEENERLLTDESELRESRKQLMELLEKKDSEMSEKNSTIETLKASFTQVSQEKHDLDGELKAMEKKYGEFEVDVATKLSEIEAKWNERCNVTSEEWAKKARDLEGIVEGLKAHQSQAEKEVSARMEIEKEANGLKEKLGQCQADLESLRKTSLEKEANGLRMTDLYVKYQEASDALRDEQFERKKSQAVLDRVIREIEQKADVILEEREKHERVLESHSELDKKLQNSVGEQTELQRLIQEVKGEMRRSDREKNMAKKEVFDLQNQVAVLLNECQNINLRKTSESSDSEHGYKDISGLVQENVELKRRVDSLSEDMVSQEKSLKEKYERDLTKSAEDAVKNFSLVMAREKEQRQMIETLQTSVATYKKLYEEESAKLESLSEERVTKKRKIDVPSVVVDNSREIFQKAHERALERVKNLEAELTKSASEIASLKSDGEKLGLEARLSQEKLDTFVKEFEHLKDQYNSSKSNNDQYSQMIIYYQEKMRKNSELMNSALESSRNLTMEVSRAKLEKEIALSSEKVSRLQASLDTIQKTEEVREEARSAERRKHESDLAAAEERAKSLEAVKESLEARACAAETKVKSLEAEVSLAKDEDLKQLEEAVKRSLEETIEDLRGKLDMKTDEELNKVSLNLATLEAEASALRTENSELKAKWEAEKTALEAMKTDADRKYDDADGEKALKEQVEEKEARIQLLMKTVERLKETLKKQKEKIAQLEKPDEIKTDDPKPVSSDSLGSPGKVCLKRPSFLSSEEAAEPQMKKSKPTTPETSKLIDINVECERSSNTLASKSGAVESSGTPPEIINVAPTLPRRGPGRPPGPGRGPGRGRGRGRISRE